VVAKVAPAVSVVGLANKVIFVDVMSLQSGWHLEQGVPDFAFKSFV
jgi:hypothetical protein